MSDATPKPTACLALADGTIFYGKGFGATGNKVAELCFNTAMT
ncbi:MAG: carbamoyl-phosphate synthase domain-containing protein, partial [Marinomonas sp.]